MNLESFVFTFRKKWVGQAMGNGTFNWDCLSTVMNFEISNELMKVELPPRKIWKDDFSSDRPSSARRVNRHLTQQDGIMLRETEHSRSCVTFFSSFCRKNVTQDRECPVARDVSSSFCRPEFSSHPVA